jgi:y4mF family transcriptional regulator
MRFSFSITRSLLRNEPKAHSSAFGDAMNLEEIGQKVRARRKLLRLRQRDLAELAGVTLRGLTDLENGRANPTFSHLAKIAEVLGLEVKLIERSNHASS